MDTRTGWEPVCSAVRLCLLTFCSINFWLGLETAHSAVARIDSNQPHVAAPDGELQIAAEPESDAVPSEADSGPSQAWALPTALLNDLEKLIAHPLTASWAQSTIQIIHGLENLESIADPKAVTTFRQLEQQLVQLDFLARQVSSTPAPTASQAQGPLAVYLRHVHYAIERRLEIWPVVHNLAARQVNRIGLVDKRQVGQFLLASRTRLNTAGIEKGWTQYLKIDDAAELFNSLNPNEYAQRKATRAVLARLYSPSLSITQQKYLNSVIDDQTIEILKVSSSDQIDLAQFLQRLERLELSDNGVTEFYLNDHYQSLLWSDDPEYQQLALKLQTHYRNANFRVSVSEELLNRMVPDVPDSQEPFRDRILGAQVVGQSRISNQIHIKLIPDPFQISMRLETNGNVQSRTTATRSGVVVENEGNSRFRVIKQLAFGQHGIFAYRPETTSQVKQKVVGLRTDLDRIPPLGWVVRKIARNKIEEQAPLTKRYAKNQIESKAESRFEREIEQHLHDLETTLTENLLHPLIALDLEPDPVEISTTADRINIRYRLAGRDQMAANTARPRAEQDCLMSLQIHESAINNIISRFEFAGKKFNNDEMAEYLNRVFQTSFIVDDGKKRSKAEFEFAPFDPIRIDFEDRQIAISVNLKSFRIGNGKRWQNLNLKVIYDPQIEEGFRMKLTQSKEGLRIKGKRLNVGDQLAIGVICEVLFPNQFEVALMPARLGQQLSVSDLQATQFVVSNGWLGISVGDAPQTAASHRQYQQSRSLPNRNRR